MDQVELSSSKWAVQRGQPMSLDEKFLFEWREAFMSKYGPKSPTTRHVLHALGSHMDLQGGSCFPSIARIATETGYSKRTVTKHITLAVKTGWIEKSTRRLKGQGWKRNSYRAVIPKNLYKMGNEVHHVSKGGESGAKGGERHSKGGEYEGKNVGNEVPLSTSFNSSKNSSCEKSVQNHEKILDGSSDYYKPTKEEYDTARKKVRELRLKV